METEPCPYRGVDDVCLSMTRVLERPAFLGSPQDARPDAPSDEVPVPELPEVPPSAPSLAFLVHGINTCARPVGRYASGTRLGRACGSNSLAVPLAYRDEDEPCAAAPGFA